MKQRILMCFLAIFVSVLCLNPVFGAQAKPQKYQLAIYFETWERIFVALTIPNLGNIAPVDAETFETMLKEFDGDKSRVVVTFSKILANDPDHLADEYKIEKLLKKYGFDQIVFKQARDANNHKGK